MTFAGNSVLFTAYGEPEAASASPAGIATQILGLLNAWRLEEGIWPFKENATLDAMAADQANFVATHLDNISEEADYHKDAQGRMPPDRAVGAPYNWPYFGQPSRVVVGENAAVGSAKSAMNFWKNSDPHRKAALNGAYREIGIAVVPISGQGFMIITDFGSRPGVLTTLASPSKDTLYFSNESGKYTTWNPADTQIKITDTTGNVITDTFPFTKTYRLPGGLNGTLQVHYLNHSTEVTDTINLASDIVILPGVSRPAAVAAGSTPTVLAQSGNVTSTAARAAPPPTNTPHSFAPSPAVLSTTTGVPSTVAALSTINITTLNTAAAATTVPIVTIVPTASTVASASPTGTPAVAPPTATIISMPDLTITYTATGLNIRNTSGKTLDLTGFMIGNSTARVTLATWIAVSFFTANNFGAGACLQIVLSASSVPDATGCQYVRSIVAVSSKHVFWTAGPFTVTKMGTAVGICDSAAHYCGVKLP